eukprot:PhF_6_TR7897/c0_g5_i4/m.11665
MQHGRQGSRDTRQRTAFWRACYYAGHDECSEVVADYNGIGKIYERLTLWEAVDFIGMPNGDLWREIARCVRTKRILFRWVRGHQDDPGRRQQGEHFSQQDIDGNVAADAFCNRALQGEEFGPPRPPIVGTPLPPQEQDDTCPDDAAIDAAIRKLHHTGAGRSRMSAAWIQSNAQASGMLRELIKLCWEHRRVRRTGGTQ